jgi:uncharacterized protein YfbU (UPF0304 family)
MAKKSQLQIVREKYIREEVLEFFEMFRVLRQSYDDLPDKSGIDENLITFDGFDANDPNENLYLQAAREIAMYSRDFDVFDSHMPRLRGYQRMLQAWRESSNKENLTKEDILRIIKK